MQNKKIIPSPCVCCQKEIALDQPIEVLECCVFKNAPKVAHQSCVKDTFDSPTCPSCLNEPTRTVLLPKHLEVIAGLDPRIVAVVDTLRLSEFVQHINCGWTSLHFLARYGYAIAYEDVLSMLQGVQLFDKTAANFDALENFVRYHHQNVFSFILDQWRPKETWCLVTEYKIVKAVTFNPAHIFMKTMLIERLLQEDTCFDPLSDNGKRVWNAFVNREQSENALIKALKDSNLLEHKLALARLYQYGIEKSDDKTAFVKIPKKALAFYLEIFDEVKEKYTGQLEQLRVLKEACCFFKNKMSRKTAISVHQFIETVHLIADQGLDDEGLLVFIYSDFLKFDVKIDDFLSTYSVLVEKGIKICCRDSGLSTPLHLVVEHWLQKKISMKSVDRMIDVLLKSGCEMNDLDAKGNTPLNLLCTVWPHLKISLDDILQKIEYFKTRGASTDIANNNGDWPLYSLFINGQQLLRDVQCLKAVMQALRPLVSFSITAGNQFGKTLLHIICAEWTKLDTLDFENIKATMQFLIELGASPITATLDGITLLHYFFLHFLKKEHDESQVLEQLRYFLDLGIDVNTADSNLIRPQHLLMHSWIEKGASRVLIFCALRLLQERGADLNAPSTPYHSVATIVARDWISFMSADEVLTSLQALQEMRVDLCGEDTGGDNLVHHVVYAFANKRVAMEDMYRSVAYLINQGVKGGSPLHLTFKLLSSLNYSFADDADFEKFSAMISLFLQNATDVNAVDSENRTILHYLVIEWVLKLKSEQFLSLLDLLCEHNADFNIEDVEKNTPVIYLFMHHDLMRNADFAIEILKRFKASKAKFEVKTKDNVSLYQMVALRGTPDVLTYLLSHCSPDHIIFLSSCRFDSASLFNCLAGNREYTQDLFENLCLYLLSINVPLSLEERSRGRGLWRNIQRLNAIAKFHSLIETYGSLDQLIHLARYYRNADKVAGTIDLVRARNVYDLVQVQLFAGKKYLFTREHLPVLKEICEFDHVERDLVALNTLLVELDPDKALPLLEKSAEKSVFSCIVLGRFYEENNDVIKAFQFYQQLQELPYDEKKGDVFVMSCRRFAHDSTLRLARICDSIPALMLRAELLLAEKDFVSAGNIYCRVVESTDVDPKLKVKAVDGLVDLAAYGKLFILALLDALIKIINLGPGNYDRSMVEKLLSAFGLELLFSDKGAKPPETTNRFFKPLKNLWDSRMRLHSTVYASICQKILSDVLYESLKENIRDNQDVIDFIKAVAEGKSPLPAFMLDEKLMARIKELNNIICQPQNN